MTISIYKNVSDVRSKDTTTIDAFISDIRSGRWEKQVLKIRETQDPEQKKLLPLVTCSGHFSERNRKSLISHSGFICIDIDNLNPDELTTTAQQLWNDQYTYACFRSVRGNGLAVLVKIDPAQHEALFEGLEYYYAKTYQVSIDRSCRDVSRSRFVSFDPGIYHNPKSTLFKKTVPKKDQPKNLPHAVLPDNDLSEIFNQIESRRIDLTQGDYNRYLRIGFSLAEYKQEAGRAYFHTVCQYSEKYDPNKCDKQYTNCLKSTGNGVNIGTFLFYCQEAGINIRSEKTKLAIQTAKMGKKTQTKEALVQTITNLHGLEPNHAQQVVEQVLSESDASGSGEKENIIVVVEAFINANYKLVRNTVTNRLENNGEVFTDADQNSLFIKLKRTYPKASMEVIDRYLNSNELTQYNPLLSFLEANNHRRPYGVIARMADTIKGYNGHMDTGDVMHNYVEFFLTKFYLGLIGSALGDEVPPIIPIIYGTKMGTGKTEFWKRLLPKELNKYFAISDLSNGQDDDILMSMKWLVCDDEWGGKMATNSKLLKAKSSQSNTTMRRAYGRNHEDITRLAMLCGTSNDSDIISDSSNRRIVPINATDIDLETYYAIDKTDALIEAYHLYTSDGQTGFLSKEENKILQSVSLQNTSPDVHAELLTSKFHPGDPSDQESITMTASEIASIIQQKTQLKITAVGIGRVLSRLEYPFTMERQTGLSPKKVYFVRPLSL